MRNLTIAVLAMALGFFGCSKSRNDETIMTGIKAGLFSDAQTKSANIDVVVKNGTATLVGEVPDENTRYEAFKIAKETSGVVNVEDQMTLPQPPAGTARRSAASANPAANTGPVSKPARGLRQDPQSLPVRPLASAANAKTPPPTLHDEPQQSVQSQPSSEVNDTPAPVSAPAAPPTPATPAAPAVRQVSVPAGTPVHIQMIDSVDSATNHIGDMFHASLTSPIAINGETILPTGTDVYVKLTNSNSAGRLTGRSELTVQLARLDFQGKSYSLASDDYQEVGKSRGKRTAVGAGAGAAVGAVLGGIFGGGRGAAIGAGAGAGAGTAGAASTGNKQVRIPSETKLDFNLQQPVDLTYSPDKNTSNR
jgi:hypothetical protein